MADETIETLERAWQDLFHRVLKAGRDQGERAAFDRILRSIQAVAAEVETSAPAASPGPAAPGAVERQSVVPIRSTGREWDPPEGDGDDRGAGD